MGPWKNWLENCSAILSNCIRAVALFLLAIYRAQFSGLIGGVCRFQPSCSCYSQTAFRTHTPGRAFILTAKRLAKCHPLGPFGYDPVPSPSTRKAT